MSEEDLRRLYQSLAERVKAFASARLGAESAKDVVSETFETAWRKADEAPPDDESRASWIFGIARNKVLQEVQRVRRKDHDNRFIADHDPRPALAADIAELVTDREVAIVTVRSLREAEQELFGLLFVLEMSPKQACAILQISRGALHTRLSRLRHQLEQLEEFHSGRVEEVER